jgi:3D (Asp-Asp-Asp) domain-containing protein
VQADGQIGEMGDNPRTTIANGVPNRQHDNDGTSIRWLKVEATAYVALCKSGCTGITRAGIDVRGANTYEGMRIIATDNSRIPLWTVVELRYADGSTERAIALDSGGDIVGNRIDLLVSDEASAWAFGRQDVELRIVNESIN